MVKKGNGGVKLTYPWRPLLLLVIECFVLRHAQGERNENEQGDEEGAAWVSMNEAAPPAETPL